MVEKVVLKIRKPLLIVTFSLWKTNV